MRKFSPLVVIVAHEPVDALPAHCLTQSSMDSCFPVSLVKSSFNESVINF